jgi:ubiquitin-conjugating enzyme E2 T
MSKLPPALRNRLKVDIKGLTHSPPPGCVLHPTDDMLVLTGSITGPEGTVYEDGVFGVTVTLPLTYPFTPPSVKLTSFIYHPNIDEGGRICLSTLKPAPMGTWSPAISLCALLTTVRTLLGCPNVDDGLMERVCREYVEDRAEFDRKARYYAERAGGGEEKQTVAQTGQDEENKPPEGEEREDKAKKRKMRDGEVVVDGVVDGGGSAVKSGGE